MIFAGYEQDKLVREECKMCGALRTIFHILLSEKLPNHYLFKEKRTQNIWIFSILLLIINRLKQPVISAR